MRQSIFTALLASDPVADGNKPRLILQPTGIQSQKTSGGKIGLALQLGPGAAVHFLLTPDESRLVRERLLAAEQLNIAKH